MNLAGLSIKRPIFITCVVSLMLILGLISMNRMSVDLFPDVTFPTVFIQTFYTGASPQDMEKLVSKPIEEEMGSLNGMDKLYSQNAEGVSYVTLTFKIGTDIKDMDSRSVSVSVTSETNCRRILMSRSSGDSIRPISQSPRWR